MIVRTYHTIYTSLYRYDLMTPTDSSYIDHFIMNIFYYYVVHLYFMVIVNTIIVHQWWLHQYLHVCSSYIRILYSSIITHRKKIFRNENHFLYTIVEYFVIYTIMRKNVCSICHKTRIIYNINNNLVFFKPEQHFFYAKYNPANFFVIFDVR